MVVEILFYRSKNYLNESNSILKKCIHCFSVFLFFSLLFFLFFLPNIYNQRFLAPGDSFLQSIPSFKWGFDLWNQYVFSGFPQFADPQAMMWYPLRILLKPLSFNAFIIIAYVLAGSFTYGYLYKLTSKISVSLFAGITYSMSGFFMAHLGHVNIIHTACWLPLILWGLENIKEKRIIWTLITSLAVTNCILAGHPQIMFYCLSLSSIYLLFLSFNQKRFNWINFLISSLTLFVGILLASIQIVPTLELMKQSVRANMTFQMFNEYSMPLNQLIILFFPFLFGGIRESFYGQGYFGEWNLTELTGYVGWLPIIFSFLLLFKKKAIINKYVLFWFSVVCVSFLLTLGDGTFLAKVMFHVPGYNLFRVPARNFFEYTFAFSVLGGLGFKTLLETNIKKRLIVQGVILFVAFFCIVLFANYSYIIQKAIQKGVTNYELNPLKNKAVMIPLALVLVELVAICLIRLVKKKLYPISIIIILLILELSSFGWFYEWRFDAQPYSIVNNNKSINQFGDYRIVAPDGTILPDPNLRPNTSQLLSIKNTTGYNPLLLTEYNSLLGVRTNGSIDVNLWNNNILDFLSVKYGFMVNRNPIKTANEISFNNPSLNQHLSTKEKQSIEFEVEQFQADQLGIVMRLSNSTGLNDGTKIANIIINYMDNSEDSFPIIVGRDVSEWAIDRADVQKIIKHNKAKVFSSFPMKDDQGNLFNGHSYLSTYPLNSIIPIVSIKIHMNDIPGAYLDLDNISLFNKSKQLVYELSVNNTLFANTDRWQKVGVSNQNIIQYENLKVLPRIRAVEKVMSFSQEVILSILKTGKLPDGTIFVPEKIALVEGGLFPQQRIFSNNGNSGEIKLVLDSNDRQIFYTRFSESSFITISDIFYPGWKAYIDEKETTIYKTNYIFRGIEVPEGEHIIELKFSPYSIKIGLLLAFCGIIIALLSIFLWLSIKKKLEP
jgi:hypothetical protein